MRAFVTPGFLAEAEAAFGLASWQILCYSFPLTLPFSGILNNIRRCLGCPLTLEKCEHRTSKSLRNLEQRECVCVIQQDIKMVSVLVET